MSKHVIVVGAGIIGVSAAYRLQAAGVRVTLIDGGRESATSGSFGWVNASFFLDRHHFQLRAEGLAAFRRLAGELPIPLRWSGCLCWENTGEAFDAQMNELRELGYEATEIGAREFATLEPAVASPPERCLHFNQEAAAESGDLARCLLQATLEGGAQLIAGVAVKGFMTEGGRVTGVRTGEGEILADQVLVAAGIGTEGLLATIDVPVPMLHRPALVLRTQPVAPVIERILVSEIGEVRQLPDGSLMLPTAVGHQRDASEKLSESPRDAADKGLARLQALLPGVTLRSSQIVLANRPMPQDGLPVVGWAADGLYVATMHSGITLAAVMGELIAGELMGSDVDASERWLSPYRPERFQR